MTTFESLNLPESLNASLKRMKYDEQTPIQQAAIPLAMEGRDILGSAQTGTGKTAAFAIPLIAKILGSSKGSAMVLTPTRELAVQVIDIVNQLLGMSSPIKTALLIGGDSIHKQRLQLKQRPRIFVGTPGRINDHLGSGNLMLHDTNFLVLDETDRMLDMGFSIQIDQILKFLPKTRQTLLFSATMPAAIIKMSEKYLTNPERIAIGQSNATATNIKQEIAHINQEGKYAELLKQLDTRQGSVIVFVKTKFGAEKLAKRLSKSNHNADAIHGNLQQNKRDRVIGAFRNGQYRVLVATDIAARGLDIPHIEHVINFDLPQCPEDYIHRIGRTARAGAEGSALSFIAPEDKDKWRAITKMLNPNAKQEPEAPRSGNGGGKRRFGGGGNRNGNAGGESANSNNPGNPFRKKKPFRFNGNKKRGDTGQAKAA